MCRAQVVLRIGAIWLVIRRFSVSTFLCQLLWCCVWDFFMFNMKGKNGKETEAGMKGGGKKVAAVFIDNDMVLIDLLAMFLENKGKIIDKYYTQKDFLDNMLSYEKDTKFFIDYEFRSGPDGIELAKLLYGAGYGNMYLFSGRSFSTDQVPSYLSIISKSDVEKAINCVLEQRILG